VYYYDTRFLAACKARAGGCGGANTDFAGGSGLNQEAGARQWRTEKPRPALTEGEVQSIDKALCPLPMDFYCVKKTPLCGIFYKFGE